MSKFQGGMIGSVANTPSGTNYTGKANGIWSLPHHIAAKSALQWAIGQTKPNPPTIGSATAISATSVSVAFIPPVQDGGATITIYTVTSSGGQVSTGATSPIVVSGLTAGTNYTFTVTATNNLGTSVSSGTSNSASPISSDPYFNSVALLLNGDSLTDWSNTPRTITNTGPVTIDTNTKKYGTGSMSFNGTSSYLSIPVTASSAISGTENFTIEAWLYPTAATTYHCFYSGQWAVQVYMNVSRKIELAFGTSASSGSYITTQQSTGTLTLNQWTHVAVTRTGNNFTIFLNGVLDSTYASTGGSIGVQTSTSVGCFNSTSYFFTGYIDDFRVTKSVARYTVNFTPPSAPFIATGSTQADPYYSSVSLLVNGVGTAGSTTFIDTSTNAWSVTPYGNAQVNTAITKYTTGSMYFDGSGDYLVIPNSTQLTLTNGDYTLEAWVYPTGTRSDYFGIIGKRGPSGREYQLWLDSGTGWLSCSSSAGSNYNSSTAVPLNTWSHVAVVYTHSNTTATLYYNGTLVGTFTSFDNTQTKTETITIGVPGSSVGAQYFTGYISDARITKGVARYKSNFTPPSAAFLASSTNTASTVDPVFSTVSLLLNGDTLTDSSSSPKTITNNGSVAVNTSTKKFGTGSLSFNGTNQWLRIPAAGLAPGLNDYTFELWVYPISIGSENEFFIFDTTGSLGIGLYNSYPFMGRRSTSIDLTSSTAIATGSWYHLAFTRFSGTTRIFVNGTQTAYSTSVNHNYSDGPLDINGYGNGAGGLINCYIDDYRYTNGIARYTSDFVPPAQALPTS